MFAAMMRPVDHLTDVMDQMQTWARRKHGPDAKKAADFFQKSPPLSFVSRSDWIRTSDPLHPMQVRYQAAPRSDVLQRRRGDELLGDGE